MQGLTTVATLWGVVVAFGLHTACYIMASIGFFYLAWTSRPRPTQNSPHGHSWSSVRSVLAPRFVLTGAFAMYATTLKPVGVCVSTPALPGLASGTLSAAPTTATVTGKTPAATRSAADLERSASNPADTSPEPAALTLLAAFGRGLRDGVQIELVVPNWAQTGQVCRR